MKISRVGNATRPPSRKASARQAYEGMLPGRPASTTRVAAVRTGAPRSDTLSITRKSARIVLGVAVHDTYPRRLL